MAWAPPASGLGPTKGDMRQSVQVTAFRDPVGRDKGQCFYRRRLTILCVNIIRTTVCPRSSLTGCALWLFAESVAHWADGQSILVHLQAWTFSKTASRSLERPQLGCGDT